LESRGKRNLRLRKQKGERESNRELKGDGKEGRGK
jgi:hypothetical protein